jgi:NTE family protein
MVKVGLVLGAGGFVGQAYHAGVLAALEDQLGWDPRTSEVIVGTSAGSLTGTALRLGVPAHDLAASALGEPLSEEGSVLAAFAEDAPEIPPFDLRSALRRWRLPTTALLARTARRPWAFRPSVAAATMLPAGWVDITSPADTLAPVLGDRWPEGLWVCATRRDDGARTVFGRSGAPAAPLGRAVAASCAIPGYFAPVEIDGTDYVDGGIPSPTNADVLRTEGLDLVVVSSSMSAVHGRSRRGDAGLRWAAHQRLEREVVRLRAAGTEVVRIEPSARTLDVMGMNAMAEDRSAEVVRAVRADAGAYLASDRVSRRLGLLARADRGGAGRVSSSASTPIIT